MFYSKKINSWFDPRLINEYKKNGNWPEDAKEYPDNVYESVVKNRPPGKIMVPDANGDPVLVDWTPSPPTKAELEANIRADRDQRLIEADHAINRLEDAGEDTSAWRKYRQALRDITTQDTFPYSVTWPEIHKS